MRCKSCLYRRVGGLNSKANNLNFTKNIQIKKSRHLQGLRVRVAAMRANDKNFIKENLPKIHAFIIAMGTCFQLLALIPTVIKICE
jgi:hypothetical protein